MANNAVGKLLLLDVLRIVAMFLVVFWHVIVNLPDSFTSLKFFFWIYNIICVNIGTIAVSLFFLVSGASLRYNNYRINSYTIISHFILKD